MLNISVFSAVFREKENRRQRGLPAAKQYISSVYREKGGSMEKCMGFLVFGWVKERDTAVRHRCFPISDVPQSPAGGDV